MQKSNFMSEFRHALIDGLGTERAATYQISLVSEKSMAVALSDTDRKVYLLVLGPNEEEFSRFDYLTMAQGISKAYNCFAVPSRPVKPTCVWAGKARGPVFVYPFKILEIPLKWPETISIDLNL